MQMQTKHLFLITASNYTSEKYYFRMNIWQYKILFKSKMDSGKILTKEKKNCF